MDLHREPKNKHTFMSYYFMTKEPRIYNLERIVSSINGVGETGQPHLKNETGPLS